MSSLANSIQELDLTAALSPDYTSHHVPSDYSPLLYSFKTITETVKQPIAKGGVASEAALKATEAVDSVAQAARNVAGSAAAQVKGTAKQAEGAAENLTSGSATAQVKGTAQQAEAAAKYAQGSATKKVDELKQAAKDTLNKL
ncbi:hypothetical protein BCR37DRAFT_397795 [Protomyces lactucae-debilis]|uniref:Uncharacterized protein n=1 Tax=Protomyces lactucae-debilis TaxID=2754530 RepID=A0A1Y2FM31_PROLT|nr:uncharacterized protein BCR37DRAFT_397795 [Protomyces lactucae-debilis]ORY84414.1 hypothetical protein BCR37DRAFT_397795 [Protomyces lactucae-debilis]